MTTLKRANDRFDKNEKEEASDRGSRPRCSRIIGFGKGSKRLVQVRRIISLVRGFRSEESTNEL